MSCIQAFNNLCKKVICPKRHKYNQRDLVQRKLSQISAKHKMDVKQLTILNSHNINLSAIGFINNSQNCSNILYLHGNGGTKLQCLQFLEKENIENLHGFNLFAFDFQGCGMSEGQFLTYGRKEVNDIKDVINYLKNKFNLKKKFNIWGRSMGGSLGLMYGNLYHQQIISLILDTPFRKLQNVFMNVAKETAPRMPQILVKLLLFMMESRIKDICGVDIFKQDFLNQIQQINNNKSNNLKIMFCFSICDKIIKQDEVIQLYDKFNGYKKIIKTKVQHHQDRQIMMIKEGFLFMKQNQNLYNNKKRNTSSLTNDTNKSLKSLISNKKQYYQKQQDIQCNIHSNNINSKTKLNTNTSRTKRSQTQRSSTISSANMNTVILNNNNEYHHHNNNTRYQNHQNNSIKMYKSIKQSSYQYDENYFQNNNNSKLRSSLKRTSFKTSK